MSLHFYHLMLEGTDLMTQFPLSDQAYVALIRKVQEGDASALLTLYDGTNRLVFGLVSRILADRISAEEALLAVYTHVWKHSGEYDPEIPCVEWLTSVARAAAAARLQGTMRAARRNAPAGPAAPETTVAPERQSRARACLAALPPVQRELLELAYFGGMSCSEIAAESGKPAGAVRTHIREGLGKLKESYCARPEQAVDQKQQEETGEARKSD